MVGTSPGPRWGAQGMLLRDKAQADFGRLEKSFSGQQKGKEHPHYHHLLWSLYLSTFSQDLSHMELLTLPWSQFAHKVPCLWSFASSSSTCSSLTDSSMPMWNSLLLYNFPVPVWRRRGPQRRIPFPLCNLPQHLAYMMATAFITFFCLLHWTMNLDSVWLFSQCCLCRAQDLTLGVLGDRWAMVN